MALINLQDIKLGFGGPLLLNGANLQVHPGERVCLLGRNGTGKTTLMKLINGDMEPDGGVVSLQQGTSTTMLTQAVPREIDGTIFDVIIGGLGEKGRLTAEYHRLSVGLAEDGSGALLHQLDQVQKQLEAGGGWEIHRQADMVITRMKLDPEIEFNALSTGLKRRVLLGRALVCQPDVLLLDEPTNHLDIDAITWLEEFLSRLKGTLLFVTHDRMLVRKLASRIIELDRGRLFNWDCDYDTYLERKEISLDVERQQRRVFDRKLAKEEDWIRQGIKARRTRNEGRVAALLRMREQKQDRQEQVGKVKMQSQEARRSGKLVIEAEGLCFSYENEVKSYPAPPKPVIHDFTTLMMRGDRIGIIGPNGCGKTTLVRLLLGELTLQKGNLRLGTNLEVTYFDQLRNQLEDEKSVLDNVADGNDQVVLDGKTRHVIGYLQDFLFTPDRSRSPVKVLSGGERNRLLLAKLFAKPSNLLVMDEPTNDLDMETLELLEELLINYKGTLLLVSHDRMFLNNVVTSTLVFEGEGRVTEYIGGYDDWLMQRPEETPPTPPHDKKAAAKEKQNQRKQPGTPPRKLSNKEKHELETLPERIEKLEKEQERLFHRLADPVFYQENQEGDEIVRLKNRLESLKHELTASFQRWEELEERKARHAGFKNS
ncbi:MAG: ATP-binding cassette domain-containing protein [bacterium]|nr:ATP-binding cassette domain-containing protein [bacterium]